MLFPRIQKTLCRSGPATSLDYLDAVNNEAAAKLAVKQAKLMQSIALLKLYYVAGKELKF